MKDDLKELDAKVADVLDSTRVALNKGSSSNVKVGDKVTIWELVEVKDPDSGDVLGIVKLDKLSMTVQSVQEKLCVASVQKQSTYVNSVVFGVSKKIISGAGESDDGTVYIRRADEATITLADDVW